MSYEIIYDKQFIKVSKNKYVPMVLSGSNNCTEFTNGRERRERSWGMFRINENLIVSEEEMLKFANDKRTSIINENNERVRDKWFEEYNDNRFGYWVGLSIGSAGTHKSTFGQFIGIFKTGCKKALTIEELRENNISVIVRNNYYLSSKAIDMNIPNFYKVVSSGDDLEQTLNDFKEYYKGCETPIITFNGMSDKTTKWLRQKYFKNTSKVKPEKQPITVDSYFSIITPNDYWFVKKLKYGYKYSFSPFLKFLTQKEAEKRVKTLGEGFTVKKVNQEHTFYK